MQCEKNILRQYFILSVTDHLDVEIFFFYQEAGVLHFFTRRRIMREEKKTRYGVTQFGAKGSSEGEGGSFRRAEMLNYPIACERM